MRTIKNIILPLLLTVCCMFWLVPSHATEADGSDRDNPTNGSTSNISIATAWKNVAADENTCIDRAQNALRNAGFNNVEVLAQSVFGDFGQYKGTVRCATSEKVAFFAVAGANADTTFRRVNEIFEGF
jgi:hypothetical protein